jgi:hypothetical protein
VVDQILLVLMMMWLWCHLITTAVASRIMDHRLMVKPETIVHCIDRKEKEWEWFV